MANQRDLNIYGLGAKWDLPLRLANPPPSFRDKRDILMNSFIYEMNLQDISQKLLPSSTTVQIVKSTTNTMAGISMASPTSKLTSQKKRIVSSQLQC